MSLVTWIIAGALFGAAASVCSGSRDRGGFALSVATGITGVMAGGWLLGLVIGASAFDPGEFSLACLLVSLLGAAVPLTVLHQFRVETSAAFGIPRIANRNQSETPKMNQQFAVGRALRPLVTAGMAGMFLLVGACASAPLAPDSALDAAKVAISNAEKSEAGRYASAELGESREKLALAENAVRDENMVAAERFARESQVEAELASARTAAAKAVSANEEMERGADALSEEMQRAGEPK